MQNMISGDRGRASQVTFIAWLVIGLVSLSPVTSQAQIPTNGLLLYLDGNIGVEQAIGVPAGNGDPVIRWLDQGPAGNHVTTNAPAATTTPTYRTGLTNGQSAVEFGIDTSTERLQATSPLITGTTDFSIFAIINAAQVNSAGYIGGNYALGNGAGIEFAVFQGKLNLYNLGLLQGPTPLSTNVWYLVQAEKSGTTYTLRVNNAFDGSTTLGPSVGGGRNWTVGNGPDYSSERFNGDIGAQLVYNRALTDDERLAVANTLADRFLIQGVPEPSAIGLFVIAMTILGRARRR